ncbi:hypothetical protein FWH13_03425 [Candidatus Saccharibacteria bacterium]|nr:hypothetical protein [Candidatus Saccharibacteria bacterium]
MENGLLRALSLSILGWVVATCLTPLYTHFAYKYKWWKKQRESSLDGQNTPVSNKLHAHKFKRPFPTMAGVIGVVAVVAITLTLNLSRSQTWLPLAALVCGAGAGLLDDLINLFGGGRGTAGLKAGLKFAIILAIGLTLGWFFYDRLGWHFVHVPFLGQFDIGWLIIPLFAFAVLSVGNAVNITDGLDGLAGGLLVFAYGFVMIVALLMGQHGIAAFAGTVMGVLISYLWFNIAPARFMMGDVGSFGFGITLGVLTMFTNTFLLLPIFGIIFVVEVGSSLLQILSKKFRNGKRIFIAAPLHHHLEAKGWPEPKIVMRFWVLGILATILALGLAVYGGVV